MGTVDVKAGMPLEQFEMLAAVRALLLRARYVVLAFALILGISAALFFWKFGSFTATASFVTEDNPMGISNLSGVASQLGVTLPVTAGGRPVDFYAELIKSPQLVIELARTRFGVSSEANGEQQNLFQILGFENDTAPKQIQGMLARLESRILVTTSRRSGVVRVDVKAPQPELAQQMARRLLVLVNEFNLRRLQSRAGEERRFVQLRVDEANVELRRAERAVESFLQQNRLYSESPRLAFEHARLQRELEVRQQVYSTLILSFEQARIEEVRNTPVLTVLEEPELYWRRSRNPIAMGIMAGVVGALGLASVLALVGWFGWTSASGLVAPGAAGDRGQRSGLGVGESGRNG